MRKSGRSAGSSGAWCVCRTLRTITLTLPERFPHRSEPPISPFPGHICLGLVLLARRGRDCLCGLSPALATLTTGAHREGARVSGNGACAPGPTPSIPYRTSHSARTRVARTHPSHAVFRSLGQQAPDRCAFGESSDIGTFGRPIFTGFAQSGRLVPPTDRRAGVYGLTPRPFLLEHSQFRNFLRAYHSLP